MRGLGNCRLVRDKSFPAEVSILRVEGFKLCVSGLVPKVLRF